MILKFNHQTAKQDHTVVARVIKTAVWFKAQMFLSFWTTVQIIAYFWGMQLFFQLGTALFIKHVLFDVLPMHKLKKITPFPIGVLLPNFSIAMGGRGMRASNCAPSQYGMRSTGNLLIPLSTKINCIYSDLLNHCLMFLVLLFNSCCSRFEFLWELNTLICKLP